LQGACDGGRDLGGWSIREATLWSVAEGLQDFPDGGAGLALANITLGELAEDGV